MINSLSLGRSTVCRSQLMFSTSSRSCEHYKLLVIGAGTGGTAICNKFAGRLGKGNVAVLDPSEDHYYQPGWTLVGAGLKKKSWTMAKTKDYLPSGVVWAKEKAAEFRPSVNTVITSTGREITYDNLVVAMGIQLRFDLIKGLPAAFDTPGVCSNYSVDTVDKTWQAFQDFDGGNAIFTFPNTPIKCAGAPQKIAYLFDAYCRKTNKRERATIMYNTALPAIFGIPKYAAALNKVVQDKDIKVNVRTVLTEIKSASKEAVFDVYNEDNKIVSTKTMPYSLIHIGAPCSAPEVLRNAPKDFVDGAGFLDIDKYTLQHKNFSNVFGIGDCANSPNAKTAAAISAQAGILRRNLCAHIAGKPLTAKYDGYASCPLVTSYNKCIMAEFGYNGPLETFPWNQASEQMFSYLLKYHVMSPLYWVGLVKGWWEGPLIPRKIMHLGMGE